MARDGPLCFSRYKNNEAHRTQQRRSVAPDAGSPGGQGMWKIDGETADCASPVAGGDLSWSIASRSTDSFSTSPRTTDA